ncbi:MAG TPA: sensor domain-containing diguanylate cyclase [Acidimicrobiales bacterium]|nr:sensor domain-containing diguanylate cyclase [Acidimicrobiales bacterium]
MEAPPKPDDEVERLAALYALDILDSEPRESLDRITRMAKRIFKVPLALVTFVDDERQWVMSGMGGPVDAERATSFCGYAILDSGVMTVNDTKLDDRFVDSPFVVSEPSLRFYAGAPLTLAGYRVGTFCLFDDHPRELTEDEMAVLVDLAGSVEADFASAQLAVVDELTGLYNRRGFNRAAEQLFKLADRNGASISVFAFDLDGLKTVNDQEGHAAGDELIVRAADLLRETFRGSDILARVGGDEFSGLVYGPCDPGAMITRLAEAAESGGPRISSGWATSRPGSDASLSELLAAADEGMYQDKNTRRAAKPALGDG